MSKLYLYSRVSSTAQVSGMGLSRQQDPKLLKKLSERFQMPFSDEVLSDKGKSAFHGDNLEKGALGIFRDAVVSGQIPKGSILVVDNLDRLSRRVTNEAMELFLSILNNGCNIYSVLGDHYIERGSPHMQTDLIRVIIEFERAHRESKVKSDRQKSNLQQQVDKYLKGEDVIISISRPHWISREGDKLVLNEHSKTFRKAIKLYLGGKGVHAICNALAGEGMTITDHLLTRGLKNPALYGMATVNNIELPNYYPALISRDEYYQIINTMKTNQRPKGTKEVTRFVTGNRITKCGECGYSYGVCATGANPQIKCSLQKRTGEKCKSNKSIAQEVVEDCMNVVLRFYREHFIDNTDYSTAIAGLKGEILEAKEAMNRYVEAIALAPDVPQIITKLNESKDTVHRLEAELAALEAKDTSPDVEDVDIDEQSPEKVIQILQRLFKVIKIYQRDVEGDASVIVGFEGHNGHILHVVADKRKQRKGGAKIRTIKHDSVGEFGEIEATAEGSVTTEQLDLMKLAVEADAKATLDFTYKPESK